MTSPLRLHVVSLPHTQATAAYLSCAYTQKVVKFCRMMRARGHWVALYAGAESDVPCDRYACCISEEERAAAVPGHYVEAPFDPSLPHWQKFNACAAAAIAASAGPRDFVCLIGGQAHKPIADALPHLMSVEFGVGYGGTFARYRVFESYAWMHTCYGSASGHNADGEWFDAVIPNYFEPEDFPAGAGGDYLLYLGRMIDRKGVAVAVEVARRARLALLTAGPGPAFEGGVHLGEVGPAMRAELLGGARALLAPTRYIEPFGGVAVEAMLCGTPVISTDWGAFTETVEHGVSGFRCHTLSEFLDAVRDCRGLDRARIRERAMARYSLEAVAPQYERYFERLRKLWGAGWYEV